jgi:hypothetical protein
VCGVEGVVEDNRASAIATSPHPQGHNARHKVNAR